MQVTKEDGETLWLKRAQIRYPAIQGRARGAWIVIPLDSLQAILARDVDGAAVSLSLVFATLLGLLMYAGSRPIL